MEPRISWKGKTVSRLSVCFVIIAFNEEARIADCIESVLAQQAPADIRIVVVDDRSTDGTTAVVDRFVATSPVQLIRQPENRGRGAARHAGALAAVPSDFVAFVDADIVLPAD